MRSKFIKSVKRRINRNKKCLFCEQREVPDYKETDVLKRYISERGKIVSRAYTGVCQKHQRLLTHAIKRARFMALLPFIVRAQ